MAPVCHTCACSLATANCRASADSPVTTITGKWSRRTGLVQQVETTADNHYLHSRSQAASARASCHSGFATIGR